MKIAQPLVSLFVIASLVLSSLGLNVRLAAGYEQSPSSVTLRAEPSDVTLRGETSDVERPMSLSRPSGAQLATFNRQASSPWASDPSIPPGATTRVSVSSPGRSAEGQLPVISGDGRHVAFAAGCEIFPDCSANFSDYHVFSYDRQTGQTTRVSLASDGSLPNGHAFPKAISGDGRYVVFESVASNLVISDTNGIVDLFVHDRQSGQTTCVSVASDGTQSNGSYYRADISADGRYVSFDSSASNFVISDTNGVGDVFVHDRQTGQTTRVSVDSSGAQFTYGGNNSALSADGRYVTFTSGKYIYVHDRQTGQTESLFSSSSSPASLSSDISADGRYVLFESAASDLVVGDTNDVSDIFVCDRQTREIRLVSVASDGTQSDVGLYATWPKLSDDGRYAFFISSSSILAPGDTNGGNDVFVHDLQTRQTSIVRVAHGGAQPNFAYGGVSLSASADGRVLAIYTSEASNMTPSGEDGVFTHDRWTGETQLVSLRETGLQAYSAYYARNYRPAMSADGRYVAFWSAAWNLVLGDTVSSSDYDVFVHDRQTGRTQAVTLASASTSLDAGYAVPSLSADGRYVAFASSASSLVPGDTNDARDVFVHDRQTSQTRRVSVASDGTPGNGESSDPAISGDGRYVAFTSAASNLVVSDTNGYKDVFVHDQQSGQTERVSLTYEGTQRPSGGYKPAISADGRYVVYKGDYYHSYVYDRQTGRTEMLDLNSEGVPGNHATNDEAAAISADGRYVAFASYASNLAEGGDTNGKYDVFVRDRLAGTTRRVSLASDGTQADGHSGINSPIAMSAYGGYVAFASEATNLVTAPDTNGQPDLFIHDMQTAMTYRLSNAFDGSEGNGLVGYIAISGDGRYVAFDSTASNLVPNDTNNNYDVFVREWEPPAVFQWLGAADDYFYGVEPLRWQAVNVDLSQVTVELAAWTSGAAIPIASGLPAQGSLDWDTTALADGRYELRATFRDGDVILDELACQVLINNSVTWHGGLIQSNETWAAGQLHVVESTAIVTGGVSLTIEPGTIVKFARRTGLVVSGTLEAPASASAPITLTTLSDDAGGDTNLDGRQSAPYPGEWKGLSGTASPNSYVQIRYAAANHAGALAGSQTWGALSAHLVDASVTIPAGAVLTIEPGAVLKFAAGASLAVQAGGQLVALGSYAQPVVFTSIKDDSAGGDANDDGDATAPQPGDWGEIAVSGQATLDDVDIRYAAPSAGTAAIRVNSGGLVTVRNSIVRDAFGYGVLAYSTLDAANTVIAGTERGVSAQSGSVVRMTNCTLDSNDIGIHMHGGKVSVTNTIVSNSSGTGVLGSSAIDMRYCDVWSLSGANYLRMSDQTGQNGNISADPLYRDALRNDYRLDFRSPAIDAADGAAAPSADAAGAPRYDEPRAPNTGTAGPGGVFADMGVFEFAEDAPSRIDLIVSGVSGPAEALAGQAAQIEWTIVNSGTAPVTGPWHDSVFLLGDEPLLAAQVLAGQGVTLQPGDSLDVRASVRVPGGTAGLYRWQVQTNAQDEVFEGRNRANNYGYSANAVRLDLTELSIDGEPLSFQFTEQGQAHWFKLNPTESQAIAISMDGEGAGGASELYIGRGAMPTRQVYAARSIEWNSPDASLAWSVEQGVTYYVLAYAATLAGGARGAVLRASTIPFTVTAASPQIIGDSAPATLEIRGGRLRADMSYALVEPGGAAHAATAVFLAGPAAAYATFDLGGAPTGLYDVRVTDPAAAQSVSLAGAVQLVHPVNPPQFVARLSIPQRIRTGRVFQGSIFYQNNSYVDMPAPIMTLSSGGGAGMRLDDTDVFSDDLQLIAVGSEGPAGVLRPQQSGQLFFSARSHTPGSVGFVLSYTDAGEGGAVDWNAMESQVRPDNVDPTQWDTVWAQFKAQAGTTWGGYVRRLAQAATLVSQRSQGADTPHPYALEDVFDAAIAELFAQTYAKVQGHVYLGDAGHPLGGATVLLTGSDVISPLVGLETSAADGSFYIDVPSDVYTITVEGYQVVTPQQVTVGAAIVQPSVIVSAAGRIAGTVVSLHDNAPISGTQVVASRQDGSAQPVLARTSAAGRYEIGGLPDGAYSLSAGGGEWAISSSDAAIHNAGAAAVNLSLAPANSIVGSVVRASDGVPIPGAVIVVTSTGQVGAAEAAAGGAFSVDGLAAGVYNVWAKAPGYARVAHDGLLLSAGAALSVPISLTLGATLNITALHSVTNQPLDGVQIMLQSQKQGLAGWDQTLTGTASLEDMAAGEYQLSLTHYDSWPITDVITLSAGATLARQYTLHPAGVISGVVTDSGAPLADVPLQAMSDGGYQAVVFSDENGLYELRSLPPGAYAVSLWGGQYPQTATISATLWTARLDFDLPGVQISGTVRTAGGSALASAVTVQLLKDDDFIAATVADPNGSYRFAAVLPGTYQVVAANPEGISAAQIVSVAASGVQVPELRLGGVTLTGQIRTVADQAAAGAGVALVPLGTSPRWPALGAGWVDLASFLTTYADEGGNYSLAGLSPGHYSLQVYQPGFGFSQQMITLTLAGPNVANVTLPPGHDIYGVVRAAGSGVPVPDAHVVAFDAVTRQPVRTAFAGSDGAYRLSGLANGSYDVVVSGDSTTHAQTSTLDLAVQNASLVRHFELVTATTVLTGLVNDDAAHPVVGAGVAALNDRGEPVAIHFTDWSGQYRFDELAAGVYTVTVQAYGFAPARLSGVSVLTSTGGANLSLAPTATSIQPWLGTLTRMLAEAQELAREDSSRSPGSNPPPASASISMFGVELYNDLKDQNPKPELAPGDSPGGPTLPLPKPFCPAAHQAWMKAFDALVHKDEAYVSWMVTHHTYDSVLQTSAFAFGWDLAATVGAWASLATPMKKASEVLMKSYPGVYAFTQAGPLLTTAYMLITGIPKSINFSNPMSAFKTIHGVLSKAVSITSKGINLGKLAAEIGVIRSNPLAGLGTYFGVAGAICQMITLLWRTYESAEALNGVIDSVPNAKSNYLGAWAELQARIKAIIAANAACEEDEKNKTKKPKPPVRRTLSDHARLDSPGSWDPNDKATIGVGARGYITRGTPLLYTIRFENQLTATAPAQQVFVSDQLDKNLDWSSVQLVGIGFNGVELPIPAGLAHYETVSGVASDPNPVRVQASLNPSLGLLSWSIESYDASTGLLPDDPYAGFLPPNDATHRGEGYVSFLVRPQAEVPTGTLIYNQARIVFDVNPPIDTNVVVNTIGLLNWVYLPVVVRDN
ncbi:MAG: carboxypeptidase regulatory-like domain-containing protein [Thermoflexales bacterium]|nr:carboxypeptidase regulatory-like domain-containing protein [Thermoflexales bacterium]